ncbi:DNA polymerase epsilon, subunit B [Meredithblackwellia eburnea MCA 4105]
MITIELLEKVHDDLKVDNDAPDDEEGDDLESRHYLNIIDAFKMPAWRWGEERNGFEKPTKEPTVAPPPTSKARYMRDRFNIIKQAILRNEHFSPPAIAGHERTEYMKLTSIKNLLGRQGGHFLIFGLLARMEDGAFYLEDLDDKVELDLSEATPESGLFTEGSFVLVDGDYMANSTFKVNEMGHPPSEPRKDAMKIFGHHDFLGIGALTIEEQARRLESERSARHQTSFVILSDVHLDNYKTIAALTSVLSAYEEMETADQPSLFVLFGNFRSRPFLFDGESAREYTELFDRLGRLLATFPKLMQHSQFLLIPGPSDPYTSQMLPQQPLPATMTESLSKRLPNVTFGSNPCRVRYFTQEIVLFRDDLMSRMMRNAVHMGNEQDESDLRKALVQTILDQAHLAPLPLTVRPVYWEFDHALRLYPMPTTLILADKFDPYKLVYGDCLVFNPGCFSRKKFSWSTYHPHMVEPKERMEER